MKYLLQFILKWLARFTLARYRPLVVGVTGSVGKTGARQAIALVLGTHWNVGSASHNYNNEIGLPLAILNEPDSGYRNPVAWLGILIRAVIKLVVRQANYPTVLVLEYGVDHPGDMDYLLSLARPKVAVLTAVAATHLAFLGSVEGVAREKSKLVTKLKPNDLAILNVDYPLIKDCIAKTVARVVTYGFSAEAQVRATGLAVSHGATGEPLGMSFRLIIGGSTVPLMLRGALGEPPVKTVLAAAAVGYGLGLSILDITQAVTRFVPPLGRLHLLAGVQNTTLLDDTYNSSPEALRVALQALAELPLPAGGRRWAILGDMLELGEQSSALHRAAGQMLAQLPIDFLVTVGPESRVMTEGALGQGLATGHVWQFAAAAEAGQFVRQKLQPGDAVLIKGSQGVRCELATKELLRQPERAKELLVRQYGPWV